MFLIRSRFRAILSSRKQSHMEQSTQNQSNPKPISSFLNSPKFLGGFLSKNMLDRHHDISAASPTSILDTNEFCNNSINHPIGYHKELFKPSSVEIKHPYEQKGIGLALENEEDLDSFSNPNSKMVLFGAKLKKVQVPEPETTHVTASDLKSPGDYGMKTKNLQLLHSSDSSVKKKSHCLREGLSLSEMELSEEYTCVITHGNDPKTIHIFDDMIVEMERFCGGGGVGNLFDDLNNYQENYGFMRKGNIERNSVPVDFLGFCYNCKVKLDDDKDIYMYRGEKSFCSPECRFQEMIMDEDGEIEF